MHRCGAGAGSGHVGHPQMEKLQNCSTFPPNNCRAVKQLHCSQTIALLSASCQRCDLDRDGKLDYQEFRAMIFRSRERKEALLREEQEQASQASAQRTAFLFISMMASSFFSSWYWWSRFKYSNVSGQVEREEKVSWEKEEEGANKQEKGEKGEKRRKKEEVKRSLPSNCCTQYKKHSEIKHTKRISLEWVIGRLFVLTHVETFILIFDCQFLSNHLIKMYFWWTV